LRNAFFVTKNSFAIHVLEDTFSFSNPIELSMEMENFASIKTLVLISSAVMLII